MAEKEMRELEIWIAENIFGAEITHTPSLATDAYMQTESDKMLMMSAYPVPRYTTDPAASMMVLEKCADKSDDCIIIWRRVGGYRITDYEPAMINAEAKTLPLAIALFAKQLFRAQEKETKVH